MFKLFQKRGLVIAFSSFSLLTFGQGVSGTGQIIGGDNRSITTAVPFLAIVPESRGGAMGDVGVATSSISSNDTYWNPGKLAFNEKDFGFSVSYNPWLRKLVNDMSLNYLSGFYKRKKEEALSVNMTYFDLGNIQFTNQSGEKQQEFRPREYAIGLGYSRKLSTKLGIGINLKFIRSNLSGGFGGSSNGVNLDARPANTAATDIGIFYIKPLTIKGTSNSLAFGANIQNIGGKIAYTNSGRRDFLPGNLKIGTAFTHEIDLYNKITVSVDFNKLLVPSPQVRNVQKLAGGDSVDAGGNLIKETYLADKPLFSGIFGSFSDATGGLSEELKEVSIGSGLEYWYQDMFAIRTGYFYESPLKGNRKYLTLGFGLRYQVFGFDFAYLVAQGQNNALGETLRFSLVFNFDKPKVDENTITE